MYGLKNVRSRRDDALTRVGWDQFESLLAAHYRGQGYQVEHVGTGGTHARFDGGIDLKLRKGDQYILVQCKHWNAKQVPHNDVHQLLGIMVNEGATGAILISSGEFTKAAIEAATRQGRVQLIDGEELRVMLGPIPELSRPEPSRAPASDYNPAISGFAANAAQRLLAATEDRIRHGARRQPTSRAHGIVRYSITALVLKIGLFLVFAWFVIVVMGGVLQSVVKTVGPKMPVTSSVSSSQLPVRASPAATTGVGSQDPNGYAHAAPDNDLGLPLPHQPTKAEIKEQQRKAAEAIGIIKDSTPEM